MKLFFTVLVFTMSYSGQVFTAETSFSFADVKTGQKILTADDNYFNRMGKAEIAIRMFSATADKNAEELKKQYSTNILEWTDAEKTRISQLVTANRERLAGIENLLPPQVIFVKVNGKVEGGLPHTRANAIILPASDKPLTETLFYHELFHVLSRQQKARHDSLYALIGFKPCDFEGNAESMAKSLTNPDVPAEGYYLPTQIDGKPSAIMTFLHASRKAYDSTIERGFSGHFGFGLLKVSVADNICTIDTNAAGKAQILPPHTVPEFFAAIGMNTRYIIHPEEVLADNFVFAMIGSKKDLANPEIPARLQEWMK